MIVVDDWNMNMYRLVRATSAWSMLYYFALIVSGVCIRPSALLVSEVFCDICRVFLFLLGGELVS